MVTWSLTPSRKGPLRDRPDLGLPDREDAFRALHALGVPLALDVRWFSKEEGRMYLSTHAPARDALRRILGPTLSPWSWTELPREPLWARSHPARVEVGLLSALGTALSEHPWRALSRRPDRAVEGSPWTTLLPALRADAVGGLWLRLVLRPIGPSATAPARLSQPIPRSDDETPLPVHPVQASSRELEDLRGRRAPGPFWEAGGLLVCWSSDTARQRSGRLSALFEAVSGTPGGAAFTVRWIRSPTSRARATRSAAELRPPRSRLAPFGGGARPACWAPAEVALWMPPFNAGSSPPCAAGAVRRGASPVIGRDAVGDPVLWPISPHEGHHVTVAGETGMGKSTFLLGLAAGLVARGAAVIVLDPLGETAEGLLSRLGPEARERCLWISPVRSPVGINALALPQGIESPNLEAERERLVSEIVNALRRVRSERYGDTVFWGPRIEEVLTRTLRLITYSPGATLADAAEVLRDPSGWGAPVPGDPEAAARVRDLHEALRSADRADLEGALRVLQEVALSTPVTRLLACRSPRWSLDLALRPGAVTLFSLERASIGARPSSYIGAALLSLLWSNVLARRERTKVVLVLDEVQEYANEALTEMLRLGRRYNLHVLAATQSVSSLSPGLREGLLTNSRDLVLFRGSPADAHVAEKDLRADEARDLPTLPRGTALVLLEKGVRVSRVAMDPPGRPADGEGRSPALLVSQRVEAGRALWEVRREGAGPSSAPAASDGVPRPAPGSAAQPVPRALPEPSPAGEPATSGPDLQGPMMALLIACLEASEGEALRVPVERVRKVCGGDERTVRRLGALLKGVGALERTERQDGLRFWWLRREPMLQALPPPWEAERLSQARDLWADSRSPASPG